MLFRKRPYLMTETAYDINTVMTIAVIDCLNFPVSVSSSLFAASGWSTVSQRSYKVLCEQTAECITSGYYCLQITRVPAGALCMVGLCVTIWSK